jgi:ribosomal protein L12E/L44/L45/RPP1/RPP2
LPPPALVPYDLLAHVIRGSWVVATGCRHGHCTASSAVPKEEDSEEEEEKEEEEEGGGGGKFWKRTCVRM